MAAGECQEEKSRGKVGAGRQKQEKLRAILPSHEGPSALASLGLFVQLGKGGVKQHPSRWIIADKRHTVT